MTPTNHKILFLNPPAKTPVFRDGYCSGTTKASFFIHPMDLLMQSGFFNVPGYEVDVIDAVYEHISPGDTLRRITSYGPDSILSLVGEATIDEDASFLAGVKGSLPAARLFLTGDIARFSVPLTRQRFPFADGLLMDFSSPDLKEHLEGKPAFDVLGPEADASKWSPGRHRFGYPLPWPGFLKKYSYQLPFFREPSYYSILKSFGCPFNCYYCNTHCLGYRPRKADEFLAELEHAARLGFKSLYIRDATFFLDREGTRDLFEEWEKSRFAFQWICFSRPDLLDEDLIARAAKTGCSLIMLGVETYDEQCLEGLDRSIDRIKIEDAFRMARRFGIRTSAQIIVGMRHPGENGSEQRSDLDAYEARLKKFLHALDPDFISLNVFHRRPGIEAVNGTLEYLEKHREAHLSMAARLNRDYYLRPRTVFRNLARLRNFKQLRLYMKAARQLVAD